MNPLLAALLVILATAASVALTIFVHGEERHRAFTKPKLVLVTVWFLLTYAVMAFAVIPH